MRGRLKGLISSVVLSGVLFNISMACNSGEECFQKGFELYEAGKKKEAYQYGVKSCEKFNYGKGCFGLGYLYEHGDGVQKDMNKALSYYKKAVSGEKKLCNSGDLQACYELGYMYEKGYGVPKDVNKAKELYKKACNGGKGYKKACK